MAAASGDMTLAFELDALRALSKPSEVFTDARGWAAYVGVVSEEPTYAVTNYTRKVGIRQDFFSGPRGVEESLASVRSQFSTERYVFIGTTEEDRAIAERTDWEYLPVEEAADAADWSMSGEDAGAAPVGEDLRDDWP